jgi:hypothetical protein
MKPPLGYVIVNPWAFVGARHIQFVMGKSKLYIECGSMCIFENQFDFFEIVWGVGAMTV